MKTIAVTLLSVLITSAMHAGDPLSTSTNQQLALAIAKSHDRFHKSLHTYIEEATVEYDFAGQVGNTDLSQRNHVSQLRLVYIRGEGLCVQSPDTALYLQASHLVLYRPIEGQYTVQEVAGVATLDAILKMLDPRFHAFRWHPAIQGFLGTTDGQGAAMADIQTWETVARCQLGDREAVHVRVRFRHGSLTDGLPVQIWFDAKTFQVVRLEADLLPLVERQLPRLATTGTRGSSAPLKARIVYSVIESQQNVDVDKASLQFRPAPDDRQVARFDIGSVRELVGSRAPEFTAANLAGKPFTLTAHRGKLVLLDFWATWCGNCVRHLPELERLSHEFAGDMVVVGVNADELDNADQVRRVLAEQGCTFEQILDPRGDVRRRFHVGGFPNLVLIDREGAIRHIFPTESPLSDLRREIAGLCAEQQPSLGASSDSKQAVQ